MTATLEVGMELVVPDRSSSTKLLNEMNLDPDSARLLLVSIGFPVEEAERCVLAWLYADAT